MLGRVALDTYKVECCGLTAARTMINEVSLIGKPLGLELLFKGTFTKIFVVVFCLHLIRS